MSGQHSVTTSDVQCLQARSGLAVPLGTGQAIKLINTHGSQVVDTWALSANDHAEHLSVEHTRRLLLKLWPREGDKLYSNRRTPMLLLERDTSPGVHDTLFACCDRWVYATYGCPPDHASCRDNFRAALTALSLTPPPAPNPLNLWMNVPVRADLSLALEPPVSAPGDYVVLRALMDVVLVLSTCPMDVTPVNGADCTPREVHFQVMDD